MEIGREATALVYKYMCKSTNATQDDINSFANVRLNIFEEISFDRYNQVFGIVTQNLQNFNNASTFNTQKLI